MLNHEAKIILNAEIDRLITDDGYNDFNKLPESDKSHLSAVIMLNVKEAYEIIGESNRFNIMVEKLIEFMNHSSQYRAMNLAQTLRDNCIEYLSDYLSTVFQDRVASLEFSKKSEAGLHPITDWNNGEIRWVK